MHPADLETFVDSELKRLPLPRAPETLLPRVLAAVQHWAQRPWYSREWFTWPLAWQAASVAALVLIIGAGAMVIPGAQTAAAALSSGPIGGVAAIARRAEVTFNAARILWRAIAEPLVPYGFALVMLMCLACAVCATALNRVALGREFQS
jgi:hypothetical protein